MKYCNWKIITSFAFGINSVNSRRRRLEFFYFSYISLYAKNQKNVLAKIVKVLRKRRKLVTDNVTFLNGDDNKSIPVIATLCTFVQSFFFMP